MNPLYHARGLLRWAGLVRRHGRPETILYFYGGIGDQLLCTAVAREIQKRRRRNLWFFTHAPELFAGHPDLTAVLPFATGADGHDRPAPGHTPVRFDLAIVPWARFAGAAVHKLFYQGYVMGEDRDEPLREHAIAALCRRAGLAGEIELRPSLPQFAPEFRLARERPRIAIQSSCLSARFPIPNKQWPVESMAQVAAALAGFADVVQLGSTADPLLPGATDRRGLSLAAAAEEMARCDLFVGLVGFLMHLARAVDCPAVIVYGGREPAEFTGYAGNLNLASRPPCAPCWRYTSCELDRACLTAITPEQVVHAARAQLARPPARPWPAERVSLGSS